MPLYSPFISIPHSHSLFHFAVTPATCPTHPLPLLILVLQSCRFHVFGDAVQEAEALEQTGTPGTVNAGPAFLRAITRGGSNATSQSDGQAAPAGRQAGLRRSVGDLGSAEFCPRPSSSSSAEFSQRTESGGSDGVPVGSTGAGPFAQAGQQRDIQGPGLVEDLGNKPRVVLTAQREFGLQQLLITACGAWTVRMTGKGLIPAAAAAIDGSAAFQVCSVPVDTSSQSCSLLLQDSEVDGVVQEGHVFPWRRGAVLVPWP